MPHVRGRRITGFQVHDPRLRWPVDESLAQWAKGQRVTAVRRRAKYLLLDLETGSLIVHLGMSGSLRLVSGNEAPRRHDHVEIAFEGGRVLRYHDPRRFGSLHYSTGDPAQHWLLAKLGVEPLSQDFHGELLKSAARTRKSAVKALIMDAHVVVGVGNIYANESLFLAGIHPARAAGRVSLARYDTLARAIRSVLERAIADGGTTLRDFVSGVGEPGYFAQQLAVYGRAGAPCHQCGHAITSRVLAQRSTFFCVRCQH